MATVIGSCGVALLLLAFALNLRRVLGTGDRLYLALNFVGASLACASAAMIRFLPFVVLEGVWAVVAAAALVRRRAG